MVSWSGFEKLPGGQQHNFESLCRSLIRLHYARYGLFAALAQQPGVEFHLRVDSDCALGSKGEWFGWQCRWYDLPSGRAIGGARRKKIAEALGKTGKVLPDLTDWVLWTRHALTKSDQKWFYSLKTKMRRHLWTFAEVETLLSGDAEILRRTYFGELVLTPLLLAEQHELSVAPVRKRWLPEAHQTVDAERTLRRMLGEAASWDELTTVSKRLGIALEVINSEPRAFSSQLISFTRSFIDALEALMGTLRQVYDLLGIGDLQFVRQQLNARTRCLDKDVSAIPRRMRGFRLPCALEATNALAELKRGMRLLDEVDRFLGARLVAVLADAGGGKTQLAAELTSALPDRPAGILLLGRELHSGRVLDDLAKRISIQGMPISSIEALVAALDAAAQRARRRLPIVIDGLNEAEDPREWKAPLSSLNALLQRFANVLVITTLRTGARRPAEQPRHSSAKEPLARMDFATQALPDDVQQIEIPNFGRDLIPAIRRYFGHFRINPGDADLPFELLSHPLTLRIFCDVTNPKRTREVGVEAMPGSPTALFEKYIDLATRRISELAPRSHRYYDQDIRLALDVIGTRFWDTNKRELEELELRKQISDEKRPWNESIIHMLEQEGVILRTPSETAGKQNVIPVYDALGGYLIANAIVTKLGRDGIESWLKNTETVNRLNGETADCHPLALDVFRSLVGLIPRRLYRQQLWQLLDEPMRSAALRIAASLEGEYLDSATISALEDYFRNSNAQLETLFRRLFETRGASNHPLNAEFLDRAFRLMSIGERDLRWTEWVRKNRSSIQDDIQWLEEQWQRNSGPRTESDRLRALWLMWLLTTTSHNLRDRTTRALYWFGRSDPVGLFEQMERASDIDDPSVFERMLAAAYGVAMALHTDRQSESRKVVLPDHARRVFELVFERNAPASTTHVLTREYGRRFIELAALQKRNLFSNEEMVRARPPYSEMGQITWQDLETGEERTIGPDSPFRTDFENYTLGRLAQGRGNYDFKHQGYKKIRAQMLWRVQQLGWIAEKFTHVDCSIEEDRRYYGRSEEHDKVDRYGKKYSWIAHHELEGFLRDQRLLTRGDVGRPSDLDVDPSFPSPTSEYHLVTSDLFGDSALSIADWLKNGPTPDLTPYLRQATILGEAGSWVMLDGYVSRDDESLGRRLFAFIRSFLISKNQEKAFVECLTKQSLGGRWLPEKAESHLILSGEVPWCDAFPKAYAEDMPFVVKESTVKVRRKRRFFFLDGKEINVDLLARQLHGQPLNGEPALTEDELNRVTYHNRIIEVEEPRQEIRRFRPLVPVHDLQLDSHDVDDVPIRGITLAKQLAQSAGLVNLPQTYDLQSADGVRATCGLTFQPQDWNNSERFFFIRETVLRALLDKRNWALVWAVWGERELSHTKILDARRTGVLADLSYGDFQTIHRF